MLRLQVISPAGRTSEVLALLEGSGAAANLVVVDDAGRSPAGDLIMCDIVEEAASETLDELRSMGLAKDGAVSIHSLDAVLSRADLEAARATPGSAADAIVWQAVDEEIIRHAEPSLEFHLLLIIATLIASVGLLSDSLVLIVGAMIVGPEYHALSAISWGVVRRRRDTTRQAVTALVLGFPAAILATAGVTAVARAFDLLPSDADPGARILTTFVSHPNQTSVWVALLAGAAGMLAILSGGSGTLLGVLVSVTTVPAAANIGLGIAFGDPAEITGAAEQLAVNLVCIVLSGIVVLLLARLAKGRRHARPA